MSQLGGGWVINELGGCCSPGGLGSRGRHSEFRVCSGSHSHVCPHPSTTAGSSKTAMLLTCPDSSKTVAPATVAGGLKAGAPPVSKTSGDGNEDGKGGSCVNVVLPTTSEVLEGKTKISSTLEAAPLRGNAVVVEVGSIRLLRCEAIVVVVEVGSILAISKIL